MQSSFEATRAKIVKKYIIDLSDLSIIKFSILYETMIALQKTNIIMQKLKSNWQIVENLNILTNLYQFNRFIVKSLNKRILFISSIINTFFANIKEAKLTFKNFTKVMKNLKLNILREFNKKEVRRIIRQKNQNCIFVIKSYIFFTAKIRSTTIVSSTTHVYVNAANESRSTSNSRYELFLSYLTSSQLSLLNYDFCDDTKYWKRECSTMLN